MNTVFRDKNSVDAMSNHVEAPKRMFGFSAQRATSRSGLLSQDCSRLNMPYGSTSNNVDNMTDQRSRVSIIQNPSLGMRSFGLQSKNLALNSSRFPEGNLRLNQDFRQDFRHRNNNTSTFSKSFCPAVRNTTLTTGLQMHDSVRYNDNIIDDGGFRRPTVSRMIRGRNSTLSSRLFHNQNAEKYFRDLSNINGFNVSQIPQREMDSMSESRLALNMRSNMMDNQSLSGSVLSVVSMKAQFLNVLENLHHSILNIGPHISTEAVRLEFDKAKQGIENMNETSFAPSIRPANAASIISQSSKCVAPQISEAKTSFSYTVDCGSVKLKSSADLLKTLISSKDSYRSRFNLSTHVEEGRGKDLVPASGGSNESDEEEEISSNFGNVGSRGFRRGESRQYKTEGRTLNSKSRKGGGKEEKEEAVGSSRKEADEEGDSGVVFKKPRPWTAKKKNSRLMKAKPCQAGGGSTGRGPSKAINLKQWYPIAVDSDLAFGGVDEKGATVKTDAVKKRVNKRKVELITGVECNLIGNPSATVSVLPRKLAGLLKNGLTDRWRVLQRELLSCQTAEEETTRRKSKSPKRKSPQEKNMKGGKSKSPKVASTPIKGAKEVHTRSGRAVKPPGMFWLVTGSEEVTSSLAVNESSGGEKTKKTTGATRRSPSKGRKRKESESATPEKRKKAEEADGGGRGGGSSNKKSERSYSEEERGKGKGGGRGRSPRSPGRRKKKRKRDVAGDADSVQSKKSKFERKSEDEEECPVESAGSVTRRGKKVESKITLSTHSAKSKVGKSTGKTNKKLQKTVKNARESKMETSQLIEFEKNFEFDLDDIEIPEIANVSGNPKLSRSQLRLVSMETPPLKYFNSNLRLLRSATPVDSPDWCISQRTESEVKQFQRRREEAFRKKVKSTTQKTVGGEKTKSVQSRDLKTVMEWVSEKTVRSPQWKSEVLQYVIPSRRQREEEEEEDDEET